MPEPSICFAALPASCPAFGAADKPADAASQGAAPFTEDCIERRIVLSGLNREATPIEARSVFLAPRILPRLSRGRADPSSRAQAAFAAAPCLVVLLPIGRYDDGVWAPIIEKLIANPTPAREQTILAWAGIDPFLAPFEHNASDPWTDPRLVPTLLSAFERRARSLSAIIDGLQFGKGGGMLRRGLVRFATAAHGSPDAISLTLA